MAEEKTQLHAIVNGRVQGVSFRYYTTLHAADLGVVGWVQNLPDGTVEILAEGTREQLEAMAEFLHHGPLGAQVISVDLQWDTATGKYTDFVIR